jgi:hypothetical protein
MTKNNVLILFFIFLIFGIMVYLEFVVPRTKEVSHGPAIRIVEKEFDTLYKIKLKYKTLQHTQIIIDQRYDTIYLTLIGDTSCAATRSLVAMHRLLDSCGK